MYRPQLPTLLIALPFLLAGAAHVQELRAQDVRTDSGVLAPSITVTGTGKVSVAPDLARIQVGVVSQSASAAEALEANNEAMQNLFSKLKGQGIADKDMQTSQFNVSPVYRQDSAGRRSPQIVSYEVRNMLHIKVRKLTNLGAVLDEVVSEGANQIQGISFTLSNPTETLDLARREAMADARRRAVLYAEAADLTLGRARYIHEQPPVMPQPMMYGMAMAARAEGGVPIASGEEEFQVTVTVTYALH